MNDEDNIILLMLSGLLLILIIAVVCLWNENKKQASEINDAESAYYTESIVPSMT